MGGIVPFEIHGQDGFVTKHVASDEAVIANKLANLPSEEEVKQWIGLAVVESIKPIVLGQLPFRNAGEASKVARDLVALAKDLGWSGADDEIKKAESAEDRADLFESFRKKAQEKLGNG